ncbi:hypothetical protein ACHAXR_003484, partial [Thalassiosira sp. AJA248-18]
LALQELDLVQPDDPILPAFESWGYQVVRTSTDQRKDCCAIAFDRSKFSLVDYEIVRFDDLATLQNNNNSTDGNNNNTTLNDGYNNIRPSKKPNSPSELTGMVRSFLRRNCAVVAHLKSVETKQSLIVASVHLYWHPGYEYVKLCQAKYLLDRVAAFATDANTKNTDSATITINANTKDNAAVIICGDMNSKPESIVNNYFVKSHVDARTVAPWRYFWDKDNEDVYTEQADNNNFREKNPYSGGDRKDGQDPMIAVDHGLQAVGGDGSENEIIGGYVMNGLPADFTMYCGTIDSNNKTGDEERESKVKSTTSETIDETKDAETNDDIINNDDGLKATLASRRLNNHITPQDYLHSTPPLPVKYMLDYTLNKFTRWLRILGIDATLETAEEENERTSGGKIALFDHCRNEQRTLLTTSYKLLLRQNCPPGAYLLDPKSSSDLERALPRLLRTHGVELSPCKFLTRCVICNGDVKRVLTDEEKRSVFVEHGAPGLVDSKEDMEVFRCDGCGQGYWWDDRSESSASRVFAQATKLLRLCLRGGVGVKDEMVIDEKKRKVIMGAFDFVDVAKEREKDSIGSETNAELSVIEWLREEKLSNPFKLRSAYAELGDTLPFTNVTKEFVGCLDYLYFEPLQFDQIGKLDVPKSFKDMNASGAYQGHLIPSDIWPSDHIAVGARLRLKQNKMIDGNTKNGMTGVATSNGKSIGFNDKSATKAVTELPAHSTKCACGCVPQILSLFEMAELRKKAREKRQAEAA